MLHRAVTVCPQLVGMIALMQSVVSVMVMIRILAMH
jgi:hypothetical protein